MAPAATPPRGKAMAVRCRPVKTRGYAISEAGGGAGAGLAGAVCAGAGVWVAALARATCWRKVRRLVDIRYRVPSRRSGWGDTFPSVGKEAGRMAAKDGRTPDYRKSHGLTAGSPAPLPASSCPPNAAPWSRRPRDERLMARWSRLLHCSGAPPAVAPDP